MSRWCAIFKADFLKQPFRIILDLTAHLSSCRRYSKADDHRLPTARNLAIVDGQPAEMSRQSQPPRLASSNGNNEASSSPAGMSQRYTSGVAREDGVSRRYSKANDEACLCSLWSARNLAINKVDPMAWPTGRDESSVATSGFFQWQ